MNQNEEIINIKNEISLLRNDIKEIKEILLNCNYACNKMSSHIDFVDNTYQSLKTPINYIKSYFEPYNQIEN